MTSGSTTNPASTVPELGVRVDDEHFVGSSRKVDIRLPEKGTSNSHGARLVLQTISIIKWIRTSRFSITNSLSFRLSCKTPTTVDQAELF
jgi:hypothetical protein